MMNRSKVALLALLAALLSFGSASAVSVHAPVGASPNVPISEGVTPSACTTPEEVFMLCAHQQPDGMWVMEELQGDDTWLVVATGATRPALVGFADRKGQRVGTATTLP